MRTTVTLDLEVDVLLRSVMYCLCFPENHHVGPSSGPLSLDEAVAEITVWRSFQLSSANPDCLKAERTRSSSLAPIMRAEQDVRIDALE